MSQTDAANGSKRLTQEERIAIPALYVALGSKKAVADRMHCSQDTVSHWIDSLSGEEWDRIKEAQRTELLVRATDILYKALDMAPDKLRGATMRDILGCVKIMSDRLAGWGGVGAVAAGAGRGEGELESILAAAEARRRQEAIEEALRSGSMEGLKAFVKV